MAGEITIERSLEQIQQGIKDIGTASRAIDKDLKAVNAGLKFDPSNVELLAKKQELLSQKLENSKIRGQELTSAIAELNRTKIENGQLTDGQSKLLSTYQQQLKETQIQVIGLTGAVQNQTTTNKEAIESTKEFSKSMTEFASKLSLVNQFMSGVDNTFKLFGGKSDSTIGKMIQQGKQAVQMMSGMASMGKLLGQSNTSLAKTFNTLALSAGAAVATYSLGTSIINAFGEENRKTVGTIMLIAGALGAVAVAGLAAAGALSWGTAIPVIMAAIGIGVAGLKGILASASADIDNLSSINSDYSTVSVPNSSSTANNGNYSDNSVTTGDTYVDINIYDADKKQTSEIIDEINTYFTNKKLAYR